jgi:hypothetical protein
VSKQLGQGGVAGGMQNYQSKWVARWRYNGELVGRVDEPDNQREALLVGQ